MRNSVKALRAALAPLGIVATYSTDFREYRVNFKGEGEATAYYTDDEADALDTGRAMAERRARISREHAERFAPLPLAAFATL